MSGRPLVEVHDLGVKFVSRDSMVSAVNGVSFQLMPGEVLCLIGEFGSGKSVTMRALIGLLPRNRAARPSQVASAGTTSRAQRGRLTAVRGSDMAMVFQEPMTALDPVYTIGHQIAETVMRHEGCSRRAATARALELLRLVRVPSPERRLAAYPTNYRAGCASARPSRSRCRAGRACCAADEPTTALDATVQIQVLILLRKLLAELGMSVIIVTDDLGVAAQIADKVAAMYAGRIVEDGSARARRRIRRTATRSAFVPRPCRGRAASATSKRSRKSPDLARYPPAAALARRCAFVRPACASDVPPPLAMPGGSTACCLRALELAEARARATTGVVN